MNQNILYALEIMGKGMGSIFAVIFLLTFIVALMGKLTEHRSKKNSQDEAYPKAFSMCKLNRHISKSVFQT